VSNLINWIKLKTIKWIRCIHNMCAGTFFNACVYFMCVLARTREHNFKIRERNLWFFIMNFSNKLINFFFRQKVNNNKKDKTNFRLLNVSIHNCMDMVNSIRPIIYCHFSDQRDYMTVVWCFCCFSLLFLWLISQFFK